MKTENQVPSKLRVKRLPNRGKYDFESVCEILDQNFICHVAFVVDHEPVVIPTAYGRKGKYIYLHGSSKSRMMIHLASGNSCSIAVTQLDGLVLARSVFHHSMNYQSVVIFGKGELVESKTDKIEALKVITDQILKGRWDEARLPNKTELKATKVIKISLDEASAKIRTGPPGDEPEDYDLDIWAGVLPLKTTFQDPVADPEMNKELPIPSSIIKALKNG